MLFEEFELSQKITKNTTFAFLGNAISRVINFFVVLLLARYLGSDLFGRYGFIFAYISIFDIIIEFGLVRILVRDISKKTFDSSLLLGNALIIRFIIIILCLIASALISFLLGYPLQIRLLLFIASLTFLTQIRSLFEVIFMAKLKMQFFAMAYVIRAVSYGILIFFAIYFKLSLLMVISFNVISGLISLVFVVPISYKYLKPRLILDFKMAKYLLKQSSPLMLSSVFIMLYGKIDVIMLSKMKGFIDIGYYTASTRLAESLLIFASTIVISVFPIISEAFKVNKQVFHQLCNKSFVVLFAIALPISIITTVYSEQIISLLYGPNYLPAQLALKIMIWTNCFIFVMFLSTHMLISINKQYVDTLISLLMLFINIILNSILIPKYSFIGSSIAAFISAGAGCILVWIYLFKKVQFCLPFKQIIKMAFLNLIIIFISLFFLRLGMNWLINSFAYLLLYGYLLYRVKVLPVRLSLK